MAKRLSIDAMCRRHNNEDVHTEHVTALALQLFDAVAPHVGLPKSARGILEAAARVHDIGYASAPSDHVRSGMEIVRKQGLPGLLLAEVRSAVGVMALHSARWEDYARQRQFRVMPARPLVMKLGAILRVADALDHGHIQNTEIVSIKLRGRTLVLRARSPGFEINLERARAKADLWTRVMPIKLDVRRVPVADPQTPFGHLLVAGLSAPEAVRRLLFYYFRSITSHARQALGNDDPIHLHDIRVGIRRFRAVLRLFRTELAPTSAEYINGLLSRLGRRLGPLRDADAWMELLGSAHVGRYAARDPRWPAYVARHRKTHAANLRRLRSILAGGTYREAVLRMSVLLRVEIPELMRREKARPARRILADKVLRLVRRIGEQGKFRKNRDAEIMHDLRILCRRGRYWTEYGAPLIGPGTIALARRLKDMADALGHLHDLDVGIESLREDTTTPRAVRGALRRAREEALRESAKAWSRLNRKKLLGRALRELE